MSVLMRDTHVEVHERERSKGRSPVWGLRVYVESHLVFDDRWVGLLVHTQASAQWLGALVVRAVTQSIYIPPAGHAFAHSLRDVVGACGEPVMWTDGVDEAFASYKTCSLHVEHMDGPLRGGVWWSGVSAQEMMWNSSAERLRLTTMRAAQWLGATVARVHDTTCAS